eukprot:3299389-Prymnesium_polylepis.1
MPCTRSQPIQLLALLSLASFVFPPDSLADRLSVSLTMLLTTVAYRSQSSADLPKLGHLPFLVRHPAAPTLARPAAVRRRSHPRAPRRSRP